MKKFFWWMSTLVVGGMIMGCGDSAKGKAPVKNEDKETSTTPKVEKDGSVSYALRGYREFKYKEEKTGEGKQGVAIHTFTFADPDRARIFVSKIFSDFELTVANKIATIETTKGTADVVKLADDGWILPLLAQDGKEVKVFVGSEETALKAKADAWLKAAPLRRSALSHPRFMDKWDRYCFGFWHRMHDIGADPEYKTPEPYFEWVGKAGLNVQVVDGTESIDTAASDNKLTWFRAYFKKNNIKFQTVEWLQNEPDLYNRNPYLSEFQDSGVLSKWSYYGELPHAPGALKDAQNTAAIDSLKRYSKDENLMAILDPNGEIGPFDVSFWGEYGPVQQRNFVRYLRDVRKFSLDDVSKRYNGKTGVYKKWEDVPMVDWRLFYGWTDGAIDLAGEWRVMRDDKGVGLKNAWYALAYDDSDWIRAYYPGDQTLCSVQNYESPKPVWMRRTMKVDVSKFKGPVYLTIAPLTEQPVQAFFNGKRLGSIDPRFHTARTFAQFDVTELMPKDSSPVVVTIRSSGRDTVCGPVFFTPKKIQDFPTDDSIVNAKRYDHLDFIDWAVADAVRETIMGIRAVDPDRPVKVHAYASSPWGWKTVNEVGGFSHHTGSGASWAYTDPKRYGLSRNLQDSSETSGSMDNPREIKGLIGNLIFMGKNAHDYFHDLQSISMHKGMREWVAERLPEIRVMGRANARTSPIAIFRGLVNSLYIGEFGKTENWRHGYDFTRGGEMTIILDELRVKEGELPYRAIFDEGMLCWDEEIRKSLEEYVSNGGILFLQRGSGEHTFEQKNARPGPTLAGVKIESDRKGEDSIQFQVKDENLGSLEGDAGRVVPHPKISHATISALEGTEILGTYKDGSPAVTRRKLGKGRIYFTATSKWPDSVLKAVNGVLGSSVYATVEGKGVDHVRMLTSNNGCEELLMLRGLGKESTVKWTLDFTPTSIYNPATGKPIDAKIEGNTVTLAVNIPDWDFAWYAARRPNAVAQFDHWFERQTQIWKGLTKGKVIAEVPVFRHLSLNHDWKLVQTDSLDKALELQKLDDKAAGLKEDDLILWSAPGTNLKSGKGVFGLYRNDFTLPVGWEKDSKLVLFVKGQIWGTPIHGLNGASKIYVNGTSVWEGAKIDATTIDITSAIKAGANRLEIINEGEGIMPVIDLVRTVKPDSTIDLAGTWQAVDGLQSVKNFELPGAVETSFIYRDVQIPADLAGKEIWLRVEADPFKFSYNALVNGRVRYFQTSNNRADAFPMEVNVTPDIRFGETNRILIATPEMMKGWSKGKHKFLKAELAVYAPGRWSADGKGIREALTATELEWVKKIGSRVQLFPLMSDAKADKKTVALHNFTASEVAAYQPKQPILDLVLDAPDGKVTDRSTNKIPVTVTGNCTPFSERDGAIKGLYLHGDGDKGGSLTLDHKVLQKELPGKKFTICAWVKPLLLEKNTASFVRWNHQLAWDIGTNSSNYTISYQWANKLLAESSITQRSWQFLTISMEENSARMYVNGVEVGSQQWENPIKPVSDIITIGSAFSKNDFFNSKIASFVIYPEAMSEADIVKLYQKDAARFAEDLSKKWPEDMLVRLDIKPDAVSDAAEIPAKIEMGSGSKITQSEGRTILSMDGQNSWILLKEDPRVTLFGDPFSFTIDFKPKADAEGTLFRRYHAISCSLKKDGTLIFDANIGQRKFLSFPQAIKAGEWNRLTIEYDGKKLRILRNGEQIADKDYPGNLTASRHLQLIVGADNTMGKDKFALSIPMELRELTISPLETGK